MKKITMLIVLGLLCLNFRLVAQGNQLFKPLKIGDKVPDVSLKNLLNYHSSKASLADFNNKVIVLDFWATWCSPCVAMIPHMDSLQKQLKDSLVIISVTDQSQNVVTTFLHKLEQQKKAKYRLLEVTQDQQLKRLFPHTYLPHLVWISPEGHVSAITNYWDLNAANVRKAFTSENSLKLEVKKDPATVAYDFSKPLLLDRSNNARVLFHSLLTPYREGLISSGSMRTDSSMGRVITVLNGSLSRLFKVAYSANGFVVNTKNLVLEVADTSKINSNLTGSNYRKWLQGGNGYCYELIVPSSLQKESNKIMQQDLDRYFPNYEARLEKRNAPCLVLTRISVEDKLVSKGGTPKLEYEQFGYHLQNARISDLIYRLNYTLRTPVTLIDDTQIKDRVDLDVDATVSNLPALNIQLKPYGLQFKEEMRLMHFLVVRDRMAKPGSQPN